MYIRVHIRAFINIFIHVILISHIDIRGYYPNLTLTLAYLA